MCREHHTTRLYGRINPPEGSGAQGSTLGPAPGAPRARYTPGTGIHSIRSRTQHSPQYSKQCRSKRHASYSTHIQHPHATARRPCPPVRAIQTTDYACIAAAAAQVSECSRKRLPPGAHRISSTSLFQRVSITQSSRFSTRFCKIITRAGVATTAAAAAR